MINPKLRKSIGAAVLSFAVYSCSVQTTSADIFISEWTTTATSIHFKLTGSITDDVSPPSQLQRLFVGPAGGHTVEFETDSNLSASYQTNLGGGVAIDWAASFHDPSSDKIQLQRVSGNFMVGDVFNHQIDILGLDSDPGAIDPNTLIVSHGRSSYAAAPEAIYQVGGFSAVPEPGSVLFITFGLGACALVRRKRQLW